MYLQDNPEDPLETPTSSLAVEYLDHRRKCAEAHNAKALQVIHIFDHICFWSTLLSRTSHMREPLQQ